MKIYGDELATQFQTARREPGMFWGKNDVLLGDKKTVQRTTYSLFSGRKNIENTIEPKVYLHICRNLWSSFTGVVREYCLPWRWKVAYEDLGGSRVKKILVCTSVYDGDLSDRLKKIVGKSLFIASLIGSGYSYEERYGKEFITITVGGGHVQTDPPFLYPIYRVRGLFSRVMYYALRKFSSEWKEIALYADKARDIYESVLIKAAHEEVFTHAGFTKGK